MTTMIRRPPGVVVPQRLRWQQRIAGLFIATLLRVSIRSWRCRWVDSKDHPITKGPVIFCVWHNRLPVALASWDEYAQAKWPNDGMGAMISASRDGALLANIVQRFGIEPIRGSSSRRGPQALLEARTLIERNNSIVITPDGPRGPVYKVQDGIIQLAKLTGRPIIPIANFTKWKIRLRSWDRFQIPLPFARCELRHGEPIWVPRDATDAEIQALRAKLEESMRAITRD